MKHAIALAALALATPLAVAAPNPLRVSPNAEIIIVGDRLDTPIPQQAAWEKVGERFEELANESASLDEMPDDVEDLLEAIYGYDSKKKTWTMRSCIASIALPQQITSLIGNTWPTDLSVSAFVENPKTDLAAINAAVKELLENKDTDITATLSKSGEWTTVRAKDPSKNAGEPFIGWRTAPEGLAIAITADTAAADKLLANTTAPTGVLAEAFKAPAGTEGSWGRIVIKDLAALVVRYTTPQDRQELQMQAPWLLTTHAITLTNSYTSAGTFTMRVEAVCNDAPSASLMADQLTMMKVMFGQMLLPQMLGPTPEAMEIGKLIQNISSTAKGNTAILTFTLTPAQAELLLDTVETLNKMQSQPAPLPASAGTGGDPFEDDAIYFGGSNR